MRAFEIAVSKNMVPWLKECKLVRRNVRIGSSIIVYLFKCLKERLYLGVKSAVLRKNSYASYTDCKSLRGRRHLRELVNLSRQGEKCAIVFIAAIPAMEAFIPNKDVDKVYYELTKKAVDIGIVVKATALYFNLINNDIYMYDSDLMVKL